MEPKGTSTGHNSWRQKITLILFRKGVGGNCDFGASQNGDGFSVRQWIERLVVRLGPERSL